jgi:rhamnogalacturonyl hydrolase YesR
MAACGDDGSPRSAQMPTATGPGSGGGGSTSTGTTTAGSAGSGTASGGAQSDAATAGSGGADGTGGSAGAGGALPDASGTGGSSASDASADTTLPPGDGGIGTDGGTLKPDVVAIMRKVADWQLPRAGGSKDWIHGAMWTGIMATYLTTRDPKYINAIKTWAGNWGLDGGAGARGDSQCAAQTFFDVYLHDPASAGNMSVIAPAKQSFDQLVAGGGSWGWEDLGFMVPPGFARLYKITGDARYFTTMNNMWWNIYNRLWSNQANLMYRDGTNVGSNTFWARGNGWVVAGIVRVLEYLPENDPKRMDFITVLNKMLNAVRPVQHADGTFPSNLLNGANAGPETSGTGFFTYAMAWGMNHGIVDRTVFMPVAQKAWKGLTSNVNADGRLGYVQDVGAGPGGAGPDSTREYGVGAFLLAGSEVAKFPP